MKHWVRKVISLMLIALGIALIAFKYGNQRSGSIETEIVHLKIENHLHPSVLKSEFPGIKIVDIMGPKFTEEDFPCMWWALSDLDAERTSDTCDVAEFEKFQEAVLNEKSDINLVVFREGLIKCTRTEEMAVFNYLGDYNLNLQELSENDFSRFTTVQKVVAQLEDGSPPGGLSNIPLKEWDRFVDKYLLPLYDAQCFRYNGKVYGPEFSTGFENIDGEIGNLSIILKSIGAALLFPGLILIRKLYFRKSGIMVNPKKVAVLYDVIVLLIAVPSAWLVASLLLEKLISIPLIYNDDEIYFMGVFFFCFGIPFVSLYTSRLTSQFIVINDLGIGLKGMSKVDHLRWDEIESIDFSDEYVAVSRVGIVLPRKLQNRLRIRSRSGDSLILNEPQLKSRKNKIRKQFQIFAPESIRDKFLSVLSKW